MSTSYKIPKYRTALVRDGRAVHVRKSVGHADDALAVAKSVLGLEIVECVLVIYINSKNTLIACEVVGRGGVAGCATTAAEIFRGAIVAGAKAIVMAHNHPSGEPAPSLDDVTLTRAAIAAGRTLGIAVLDHLIIGRDVGEGVKTVSLREQSDLGWDS